MSERTAEQQRFRTLKKAWKPPKAVRRALLWVAFAAGGGLVVWQVVVAASLAFGGAA
jgi:hypothetical protein